MSCLITVRLIAALSLLVVIGPAARATEQRMNVLLIIADDLRAEMGCYGSPMAKTPHLDRLAMEGVRFDKAYCQFPLCNPSRSSVLTGLRPTTVGVLGNRSRFGATRPGATSLTQHFKDQGYATWRAGKIFHGGIDDTDSWSLGGRPRYFGEDATAKPPEHNERGPTGRLLSKTERSDRWVALPPVAAPKY